MDIEAMKREASEQQSIAGGDRKSEEYKKSLSAHGPESDSSKPSQEVAKKIAKAAGVKSKSMRLPRHSALATSRFWQDLRPGWGFL